MPIIKKMNLINVHLWTYLKIYGNDLNLPSKSYYLSVHPIITRKPLNRAVRISISD